MGRKVDQAKVVETSEHDPHVEINVKVASNVSLGPSPRAKFPAHVDFCSSSPSSKKVPRRTLGHFPNGRPFTSTTTPWPRQLPSPEMGHGCRSYPFCVQQQPRQHSVLCAPATASLSTARPRACRQRSVQDMVAGAWRRRKHEHLKPRRPRPGSRCRARTH